ncbi:MAG: YqeG family HAD IIIA-type phosphatase [Ruminococcaceae bacterium]|nr:YqeG family HAD IIIA-type phosphatase [Oscillospiraceae bacterium]
MKDYLTPDYMFGHYYEITPEFLQSIGVRALLIDIDNTLAPYEQPDPDESIRAWFARLAEAGISVALVSNNHAPRVERFNQTLGLLAYPDSGKPKRKTLEIAMQKLGVTHAETAMLGDQLLTDAYAGKHIGLRAIIVPPIHDKTNLFFRFKRLCERPFIRKFAKKNRYRDYLSFWKIKKK